MTFRDRVTGDRAPGACYIPIRAGRENPGEEASVTKRESAPEVQYQATGLDYHWEGGDGRIDEVTARTAGVRRPDVYPAGWVAIMAAAYATRRIQGYHRDLWVHDRNALDALGPDPLLWVAQHFGTFLFVAEEGRARPGVPGRKNARKAVNAWISRIGPGEAGCDVYFWDGAKLSGPLTSKQATAAADRLGILDVYPPAQVAA